MYVHEEGRASCAQSEWMASCVARMADADDGQQVFATWRNGREVKTPSTRGAQLLLPINDMADASRTR